MFEEENLYFKNHMLLVGYPARFWGRVLRGILGIVSGALLAILLLSDVRGLFYAGFLLLGFWVYRLFTAKQNKKEFKGGNLFSYTTYRTRKIIESAYDKSAVVGGGVLLNITRELADTYQVEAYLHQLGVQRSEFIAKLESFIEEETSLKETNKWRQVRVEDLVVKAFKIQEEHKEPIAPIYLFKAMIEMDSEKTRRLFGLFGIGEYNENLKQENGQDQ